jgi:hypothetical protein
VRDDLDSSGVVIDYVDPLHLREASVHEQLGPCNLTAVVGRKKNNGFRDLIGCFEPPKRNCGSNGAIVHGRA